ncbi:hypothetical protein ACLEDK_16975 [Lonsdalea quercina]|uniref:hypothetical protein n=1 Tax=Lonsdalea quercina TaxID=71657 RepID=UPI00397639CC
MNTKKRVFLGEMLAAFDAVFKIFMVFFGVYLIWIGVDKLFNDHSFSFSEGGSKVISVFDTTPFAIIYILCGAIILTFSWIGSKREKLENE